MVNGMDWLYSQEEYNTREKRKKVEILRAFGKNLESHLDLRDFINLEKLYCSNKQLTSLDVSERLNKTEFEVR